MMLNGVCIKKKCFYQEESHGYVKIKHEKRIYLVLNIVYKEEINQTEEKTFTSLF